MEASLASVPILDGQVDIRERYLVTHISNECVAHSGFTSRWQWENTRAQVMQTVWHVTRVNAQNPGVEWCLLVVNHALGFKLIACILRTFLCAFRVCYLSRRRV